jgi:hypothetical protein
MDEREIEIRKKLKNNLEHYSLKCLKVRVKSGAVVPLVLNKAQRYIDARLNKQKKLTGKVRAVILKGRQQGCSTYVGARFYHQVSHNFGTQAFILTHALDATQNLYKMAQRYYENTPALVKPQVTTSNAKELIFGQLDSGYKLGTAENKSVGRSSTIQLLHGSEVAFWNNAGEHAKGIMQAVPNTENTEIILESTANGMGNYYHQMWQSAESGESDYIAIFVPWFWQDEYRVKVKKDFEPTVEESELKKYYLIDDEQLAWRRLKIAEFGVNGTDGLKAFYQEYPCNPQEAFQNTGEDSYIKPEDVIRARKNNAEQYGNLVLGVDPARFGDDRTAIIRRKGRNAFGLEMHVKKDTMEIVGRVNTIINEEKPHKVFIDIGGLGAGIYDRLKELGHGNVIVAVNSANAALDSRKYSNKRAEMWHLCKEWIQDTPSQIPDSDELQADLCNTRYSVDSNSRLKMERKEDMKKRGIRSSDAADALCLTFAYPTMLNDSTKKQSELASKIMLNTNIITRDKMRIYG